MRFAVIILFSALAFAQSPEQQTAQIAVQQAQQTAIQQTQQAQQDTQQANDAARRANQQAMDANAAAAAAASTNSQGGNGPAIPVTHTPKFSPKPGTFKGVTPQVKIAVATPGAVVYYTTDGSIPTSASQRYQGPITLSSTTILKATAVAPASAQSPIAQGKYIVK